MNNLAKAIQTNTSRRNRRCLIDQIDSLEHSLMMMLNRKGKSRKDMHGMPEELKEKFLTFYAHVYLLRSEYENYLVVNRKTNEVLESLVQTNWFHVQLITRRTKFRNYNV